MSHVSTTCGSGWLNILMSIQNETEKVQIIDTDVIDEIETSNEQSVSIATKTDLIKTSGNQKLYLHYLVLPFLFLVVTLLGGLRFSSVDASFIFLKPALLCLIFASILVVLYLRAGLIGIHDWFSEDFPMSKNIANGAVLLVLFTATTQLFNSLVPEQGLPFWIVAFCFFWTLWNNLFADFDTKKLLRSLGALFGLAFVAKYLVLANLTAPTSESWLRSMIENPAQSTVTWLLDLPKFSAATGYIQFFAVALYLLGLFLLPQTTRNTDVPE
jgi:intracellular septation protein A